MLWNGGSTASPAIGRRAQTRGPRRRELERGRRARTLDNGLGHVRSARERARPVDRGKGKPGASLGLVPNRGRHPALAIKLIADQGALERRLASHKQHKTLEAGSAGLALITFVRVSGPADGSLPACALEPRRQRYAIPLQPSQHGGAHPCSTFERAKV